MMVQQAGFNLPTMGKVPTAALDSILPYLSFGPNLAMAQYLAQLKEGGETNRTQITAQASMFGDQVRAAATQAAAAAQAGATVEAQQIQTRGQLAAVDAQIQSDLVRARMGDVGAAQRLQAELGMRARLANQDTTLQLAKMMGSGQLRDAIGARLALGGFGQMPGADSALGGLRSPYVDEPTVAMPPQYPDVHVGGNYGQGFIGDTGFSRGSFGRGGGGPSNYAGTGDFPGGGNYGQGGLQMPTFGGGGGGTGGGGGGTFNDILKNIRGALNWGNVFNFDGGGAGPPFPAPHQPSAVDALGYLRAGDQAGAAGVLRQVAGLAPLVDVTKPPPNTPPQWANGWLRAFGSSGSPIVSGDTQGPTGIHDAALAQLRKAMSAYDFTKFDGPIVSGLTGTPTGVINSSTPMVDPWAVAGPEPFPVGMPHEMMKVLGASHGGRFDNQAVLVGDSPSGRPTGVEELVVGKDFQVLPLRRAAFGTFYDPGGGGTRDETYATPAPQPAPVFKAQPIGTIPTPITPPAPRAVPLPAATAPAALAPVDPLTRYFGPDALGGATGGALADLNRIPALAQLRTGRVLPAFGMGPQYFKELGMGFGKTPAPYLAASTYNQMSPFDQEDALQSWEFGGWPRSVVLAQIANATPGFRRNPQRAFGLF